MLDNWNRNYNIFEGNNKLKIKVKTNRLYLCLPPLHFPLKKMRVLIIILDDNRQR